MSKARGLADLGNVYNDGALSNRNLVINGAMQVAQRGLSSTSIGVGSVDRFGCTSETSTNITQSQQSLTSSDDPYEKGFRNSFRATVTTTSSSATSFIQLEQKIEAQDIAQSGWEYTNPNSYLTFSFWAKSSLAGTYYAQFRTSDSTSYYYNKSFTLAANTWKKLTVTVSGNSNLTINNDTGEGFRVLVIPDYGTDYSGHAEAVEDAWYARSQTSGYTPSYTQDWQNTSGATFEVTGVQLEVGDTATPFEHRSYGQELTLCQRYYYQWVSSTASNSVLLQAYSTTSVVGVLLHFPVTMRAVPTSLATGSFVPFSANGTPQAAFTEIANLAASTENTLTTGAWGGSSGLVAGNAVAISCQPGSKFTCDAEL